MASAIGKADVCATGIVPQPLRAPKKSAMKLIVGGKSNGGARAGELSPDLVLG